MRTPTADNCIKAAEKVLEHEAAHDPLTVEWARKLVESNPAPIPVELSPGWDTDEVPF